ncbi:spore germination protein [Anaerobacillus arseniciselenatis]|uniref:Spore germination protein n=1 Tax=Anaerobacillus arseniciselenatis TaxID=85682 RepID=A0A1S2LMZ6_9BACI|nr:spore germination protein [Anaerobacillus arseniciselenatis]OIJ12795.1 spore germination protein [Anaerobacillus arseniciselenatis]
MYYKKWEKQTKLKNVNREASIQETEQQNSTDENEEPTFEEVMKLFNDCDDLEHKTFSELGIDLIYFSPLVDDKKVEDEIINSIYSSTTEEVKSWVKKKDIPEATSIKDIKDEILSGSVGIFFENKTYYYNVYGPETRGIDKSETETVIVGAHDAFVEDITTNLSLVRRRVKSSNLKAVKLKVGEVTKTYVYVLYIDGIADSDMVSEMKERISKIEVDSVYDTNMLAQLIDEVPDSLFPQYYSTELPDVVRSKLVSGKMVVLLDTSPIAISAPSSFFEFIQSPDDYNQRWLLGTGLRILRAVAIFITLSFTAMYVAVITFHYEVLPEDLLITLAESRARVPFPPLIEALLMEVTIELLREAGARLPTKIGQTIGIVGGIVIGQAAVEAGLTSNILIIAVASSAIASFVLPNYNMSNSIRIVRFFLIILAGFSGIFGIVFGVALIAIHLASLTSLKTPYLIPMSPFYWKDWVDTFIRGPYWAMKHRPIQTKTDNTEVNKMKQ